MLVKRSIHAIALVRAACALRTILVSLICAAVLGVAGASAQTFPPPNPPTLPMVTIGTAALMSPTSAATYYGSSTTSTDGLAAITGTPTPTPPEIIEMARALKFNVDLIYQYVRNNIQVSWMYGLQKGALGALIDKGSAAHAAANRSGIRRAMGADRSLL